MNNNFNKKNNKLMENKERSKNKNAQMMMNRTKRVNGRKYKNPRSALIFT